MIVSSPPRVAWRTSTRSGNGGNCVEVAALDASAWHKSTRSGKEGECVEVTAFGDTAWRTSTRSNQGGNCVQAASTAHIIAVRDSKDPAGPHLDFSPRDWQAFVTSLKDTTADGGSGLLA